MSAATIFLVIIIVLLLAAAVVFLILWLNNRNKKNTEKKDLEIEGVKFTAGENSVTANWTSVGNGKDVVTLYADTIPINFSADGKPELDKNPKVKTSQTVSGNAKTVTLGNLALKTKYYVSLVVTNPDFTGFNPTNSTVTTGADVPTGSFIIQEIHTVGDISLDVNDNTKVTYDKGANKADTNDLWSYDTEKFTISTRNLGASSTAPRPTLFNNNGILAAKPAEVTPSKDSQWEYKDHRWCLRGTDMCMDLESPITTGQEIKVVSNAKTQWVNESVRGV